MGQPKNFDCVWMKWDIQQKLAREFAGSSDENANKAQMERVSKNHILGPFLKKIGAPGERKHQNHISK